MRYVISYDLNKPLKDYPKLWAALEQLGAKRILLSQWIVRRTGTNALNLVNHLLQFVDTDDRILIMSMDSGDAAWYRPLVDPASI